MIQKADFQKKTYEFDKKVLRKKWCPRYINRGIFKFDENVAICIRISQKKELEFCHTSNRLCFELIISYFLSLKKVWTKD